MGHRAESRWRIARARSSSARAGQHSPARRRSTARLAMPSATAGWSPCTAASASPILLVQLPREPYRSTTKRIARPAGAQSGWVRRPAGRRRRWPDAGGQGRWRTQSRAGTDAAGCRSVRGRDERAGRPQARRRTAVVPSGRGRRAAGRYGADAAGGAGAHAEQVTSPVQPAGAGPDRVVGRSRKRARSAQPFTAPPGRGTRA